MICTAILFLLLATAWIDILVKAGPAASSDISASHGKSTSPKPLKGEKMNHPDMSHSVANKQAPEELFGYNKKIARILSRY